MAYNTVPAWKSYRLGSVILSNTGEAWKIVDVQSRRSLKGYKTRMFTLESEQNGRRIRKTARGITMFSIGLGSATDDDVEAEAQQQGQQGGQQGQQGQQGGQQGQPEPEAPKAEPEAPKAEQAQPEPEPEIQIESGPIRHANHNALLRMVDARLNIWLVGPAGSGKTSAAEAVAQDLNLKFYSKSVGPQTTESSLLGYQDANGSTIRTLLREAFEHGGVMLLDEIDAANPGVLVVVNSLLANDFCAFPDGMVKKHADFVLIAGANTIGQGADRQYVGRQQIDGATLDRFVMMVWEYDPTIEARVAGASLAAVAKCPRPKAIRFETSMGDNRAIQARVDKYVAFVVAVRNAVNMTGKGDAKAVRFIVSPRASKHGAALIRKGFTMADTCELALWKGFDPETRAKLEAAARASL